MRRLRLLAHLLALACVVTPWWQARLLLVYALALSSVVLGTRDREAVAR